eukprot:Phypoly_transcript_13173.p1 GENE.Phypoly_transcript_13173~~Phypoly_transcript_13173.p1  ORF type:complete len:326 (+),score=12.53 Phypoly_transcript_13173:28-978(+)
MALTDSELRIIVIAFYISSSLNFIGSLFTIITFLIFKDARNSATYFIFALALSDFCSACGTIFVWIYLVDQQNNVFCKLQGGLQMFGLIASILWGLNIGIYLFLALYKNVELELLRRFKLLFHIFAWGYAAAATALPYMYNEYSMLFPQSQYSWCWIGDPKSLHRLLLYIPDTFTFATLTALYFLLQFRLYGAHNTAAKAICKKMNVYLATYAAINLFAIINRMQNFVSSDAIFELYLLQFATQPLQGFLNAIAYIWNEPEYLEKYKLFFYSCISLPLISTRTTEENERLAALMDYEVSCELFHSHRYGSINRDSQ